MNAATRPPRLSAIDAFRGAACVWMAVYHFCFDLSALGWRPDWNFYSDPFWTWQRTGILSSFLLCAGMGQGMASSLGQSWARFWRRWGQILLCAVVVSASTYAVFGPRFVYFGVLHGMALMLLLTRWLAPKCGNSALVLLALACIATPMLYGHFLSTGWALPAAFDAPWLNWLGLISRKPPTEDYVPLLPWWGMMLLGLALQRWLYAQVQTGRMALEAPTWAGPLVTLGRHSLSFYMLHQPLFWLGLYAAAALGLKP